MDNREMVEALVNLVVKFVNDNKVPVMIMGLTGLEIVDLAIRQYEEHADEETRDHELPELLEAAAEHAVDWNSVAESCDKSRVLN
jgi:non-ribosomal peptide synthetase component F